jgi:acyl carrier protein
LKSRSEVESTVDRILMSIFKIEIDAARMVRRSELVAWTSLMHVEVFFALEEEFGVRFPEDDLAFAESRDDLVDTVCSALSIG